MSEIKIEASALSNPESLNRPAWTQNDLNAYKNKHCFINGRYKKLKNYYVENNK